MFFSPVVTVSEKKEMLFAFLKADPILTFFGVAVVIFIFALRWLIVRSDKKLQASILMYENKIVSIVEQNGKDINEWANKYFEQEKKLIKELKNR